MLRAMAWQPELDELRRREELARRMGGEERVARQHASGRLTVRERVARLLDEGTFHETGALAGKGSYAEDGELEEFTPANVVVGRGLIDGPRVVAAAMGEAPDKEMLGGARAQTRAGAVDNEAADEDDALAQLKRVLSYLPTSVWEAPPAHEASDRPDRREEELLGIVPRER